MGICWLIQTWFWLAVSTGVFAQEEGSDLFGGYNKIILFPQPARPRATNLTEKSCVSLSVVKYLVGSQEVLHHCPDEKPYCDPSNAECVNFHPALNNFTCPGEGVYADLRNETKFFLCVEIYILAAPSTLTCRHGQSFNIETGVCSDTKQERPSCEGKAGKKVRLNDPSGRQYMVCGEESRPVALEACDVGMQFDDESQECKFVCMGVGAFPVARHATRYIECQEKGDELVPTPKECPAKSIFIWNIGKCAVFPPAAETAAESTETTQDSPEAEPEAESIESTQDSTSIDSPEAETAAESIESTQDSTSIDSPEAETAAESIESTQESTSIDSPEAETVAESIESTQDSTSIDSPEAETAAESTETTQDSTSIDSPEAETAAESTETTQDSTSIDLSEAETAAESIESTQDSTTIDSPEAEPAAESTETTQDSTTIDSPQAEPLAPTTTPEETVNGGRCTGLHLRNGMCTS